MLDNLETRFSVDLDFLKDKSVLITGGTGSFGKALTKKMLDCSEVKRIVIFSRDEFKQFNMEQSLTESERKRVRMFLGDVRDFERLRMALFEIDYVFHAAALKQVPAAEYNPFECIKTNVIGAENIAQAAMKEGVKSVVALSTDKAAAPLNLYGASKLASDKILIAANHMGVPRGTRFSVVRYGNVVGSRGSVVPFFKDIVKNGGTELPITDPNMTRFFISIGEGVNFSLSVLKLMTDRAYSGDIHIPKLPSIKITELANIIGPGLKQTVVGIRPGEKIHEEIVTIGDNATTIEIEDRYIIEPHLARWKRESLADWEKATPVAEDFCYNSGNNTVWLEGEPLKNYIDDALNQVLV